MTQLLLDIAPAWLPTPDNFVVARNRELYSALCAALDERGQSQSFYLWGESGSGKTHLLKGMVGRALEQHQDAIYAQGEVPECAGLVAVDDVEALGEDGQIKLFELYNHVRESGGILLVSGQIAPAHLNLREDLRTRLGWGMVYQVHTLNDDEKALALQHHAAQLGLSLPPEVTNYMLRHGRRDLPSLLGVLDALDEACLRLKRPAATVPLLKEVMSGASLGTDRANQDDVF